jgi:hypothetical protein
MSTKNQDKLLLAHIEVPDIRSIITSNYKIMWLKDHRQGNKRARDYQSSIDDLEDSIRQKYMKLVKAHNEQVNYWDTDTD